MIVVLRSPGVDKVHAVSMALRSWWALDIAVWLGNTRCHLGDHSSLVLSSWRTRRLKQVEAVVKCKFGVEGLRIFRLLALRGQLEQKQVGENRVLVKQRSYQTKGTLLSHETKIIGVVCRLEQQQAGARGEADAS